MESFWFAGAAFTTELIHRCKQYRAVLQDYLSSGLELALAERAAQIFAGTGLYLLCAVLDPTAR